METLKTALVVVLLLAVLYGVYVVLNKPDLNPPPELAWQQTTTSPPELEFGEATATAPATFAPVLTAPPEMQPSMTPAVPAPDAGPVPDPDAMGSDPQNSAEEAAPAGSAALSSNVQPAARPAEFGARPAGATIDDLSPAVVPGSAGATGPDNESSSARQRSIYEQPLQTEDDQQSLPRGGEPTEPLASEQGEYGSLRAFENAWNDATGQLASQHWVEALLTLSLFYDKPELSGEQRQRLVDLLDPLAGKVIYSTEHLLEPPYQVRPGETLQQIAERYQVPVTLLQNINGISDPANLPPGSVLKVLRGPFRAEVNLAKDELVLFLGKYYAGRFAISVGNDPAPQPGEYAIAGKQEGREYFAPDGTRVPPLAADNPYGRWWLDLGGDVCIHATAETTPSHGGLGCISLDSTDAGDVFGILSIGSKVLIR